MSEPIQIGLISFVIPAKNEAAPLKRLLADIRNRFPASEIIVVNDGSSDDTSVVCRMAGVREIRHVYSIGNGGAIKAGARAARGEILVFLDADGQHDPANASKLLDKLRDGYDMAVGARSLLSQASAFRALANRFYNWLASWMTQQQVHDLTSGFRAVGADKFREYLHLLPNGFSYPTTITMAFFRTGYTVGYVPIEAAQRQGVSHIRPVRDGLRFLLIIFKIGTLYSPLKLFLPIGAAFFLAGDSYYL